MSLFKRRKTDNTVKKPETWVLPSLDLLESPRVSPDSEDKQLLKNLATKVQGIIKKQNCNTQIEHMYSGPRVNQIVYKPVDGDMVPDKSRLERAIAQALDIHTVRVYIEKTLNGRITVELGKSSQRMVYLKDALRSKEFQDTKSLLSFPAGVNTQGKYHIADFNILPNVLAGGQTGSGKSSFTEGPLIASLLFKNTPDDLILVLIDPKMIQFSQYNGIPHLAEPVITHPDIARKCFESLAQEMETRFSKLSESGVSNISEYNMQNNERMPAIVVVIDEVADLMMIDGDYYEKQFISIFYTGRAVGIHLYIGTSRPSSDIFTDMIVANTFARIAFTTASRVDSERILHMPGAERLLGKGDMLFADIDHVHPQRLQAPYVTEEEVDKLANFWKNQVKS